MTRNANLQLASLLSKVEHDEHHLIILLAKEGKIGTWIKALRTRIHIHQVEGITLTKRLLLIGKSEKLAIGGCQIFLLCSICFLLTILIGMGQGLRTPIVEYRCTAVSAAESFLVHTLLAKLLSAVEHKRILLEEETHGCRRNRLHGAAAEEVAGDALLVMVLQEVEHVLTDIIHHLPLVSDAGRRTLTTNHAAKAIVHAHLVVEIIETRFHVVAILVRIIYLADNDDMRILRLQNRCSVRPECSWHHLCHIAAESIHTLACPVEQDIRHLAPGAWHRLVVIASATCIAVIHTIVELHGLIPVAATRMVVETVISRSSCRTLLVWFIDLGILGIVSLELRFSMANLIQVETAPCIIEIVLGREVHIGIIIFSEIPYTCRFADGMILTSHMIRHKVHDNLHASLVRTLDKTLPLLHSQADIHGQIRVDVIIVGNGVWRSCLALYHLSMLGRDSIR